MKINFRALWKKILNPPVWAKILTFIITVLSAVFALVLAFKDGKEGAFGIASYALFAIAGVSLAYSVYLLIPLFPKMKRAMVAFMERHDFTYLLLRNFGFRTVIFSIGSFLISVLFGAFNAYMGVINRSIWHGALSAFYISLALLRGGVLTYHKNRIGKNDGRQEDEIEKAKIYRNCGIVSLVLSIALISSIAQMVLSNAHFNFIGWTIFAYAAYAFFKITTATISFIKAHKQTDLTVRAIRNVNLIDALVSILALQTALLATFSQGEVSVPIMNAITGIAVGALSVAIGIYMIISAKRKINKIRKEDKNYEQSI